MNLKRNSWHGHLAMVYGPLSDNTKEVDICRYVRAMIRGALVALLILLVSCGGAALVASTFAWCAAMFVQGHYIQPDDVATVIPIVILAIAGLAVYGALICLYQSWKRKRRMRLEALASQPDEERHESPVVAWYQSVKSKTCFKINLS